MKLLETEEYIILIYKLLIISNYFHLVDNEKLYFDVTNFKLCINSSIRSFYYIKSELTYIYIMITGGIRKNFSNFKTIRQITIKIGSKCSLKY